MSLSTDSPILPRFQGALTPRLEEAFVVLAKGGDYIKADKLANRLQEYYLELRLTRQERERLLAATNKMKGVPWTRIDFTMALSQTHSTPSKPGRIRRIFKRTIDIIAMPGPRNDPVVLNYEESYSCRPPPLFILGVTLLDVAVYVFYCASDHVSPAWGSGGVCPGCRGPLAFDPRHKAQAWRYVTYSMVHAGVGHIFLNLVVQVFLGVPLEMVHKPWRVAPIYVGGAIVGALLQAALNPHVILVGASGAGYALIVAHLSNVLLNWSEMPYRWYRLCAILIFVAIDVGQTVYLHYYACHEDISYSADIGGAITGFWLGFLLLRNQRRATRWEKLLRIVCGCGFLVLVVGLVVANVLITQNSRFVWKAECPR